MQSGLRISKSVVKNEKARRKRWGVVTCVPNEDSWSAFTRHKLFTWQFKWQIRHLGRDALHPLKCYESRFQRRRRLGVSEVNVWATAAKKQIAAIAAWWGGRGRAAVITPFSLLNVSDSFATPRLKKRENNNNEKEILPSGSWVWGFSSDKGIKTERE